MEWGRGQEEDERGERKDSLSDTTRRLRGSPLFPWEFRLYAVAPCLHITTSACTATVTARQTCLDILDTISFVSAALFIGLPIFSYIWFRCDQYGFVCHLTPWPSCKLHHKTSQLGVRKDHHISHSVLNLMRSADILSWSLRSAMRRRRAGIVYSNARRQAYRAYFGETKTSEVLLGMVDGGTCHAKSNI